MLKNSPSDLKIEGEKLYGFHRGVVEDRVDPLKSGRVRIRIHGLHTAKKSKSDIEGIPTDELPWAEPALPSTHGSVSGFGEWGVPLQGSQVLVFFENGNISRPIYFASMPGIPEAQEQYSNNNRETSKNDGFRDPDGEYPTKHRLGEPDFHRLARGESSETLVTTVNQQRALGVPTALGGSWNEPESAYNAQYPHNHVITTEGGITIELDSTPGSTRINIYHPSNSFISIDNDGNMVVKNNAEKYEIVGEGKNIYIKQQRNETVDGDAKKRVIGNEDIEVGGDKGIKIDGDKEETIDGDQTESVGGAKDITIGGNESKDISGAKADTIGGNESKDISGNKTDTLGGNLTITVTGNINITASGNISILSGSVKLGQSASVQKMLNAAAATIFNNHTHGGVDTGSGSTQGPSSTMGGSSMTSNTEAS